MLVLLVQLKFCNVTLECTLIILIRLSLLIVSCILLKVDLRSIVDRVVSVVLLRHASIHLFLQMGENLLNEQNSFRLRKEIEIILIGSDLLSLVEEITSVLGLSLLLSSYLRYLIVGNIKLLSVE